MKNFHEKPLVWDKLYAKSDNQAIAQSLSYGLKNIKRYQGYYGWLDIIIRNKLKFKRSLEVGSGTGTYSLLLKKLGIVEEVYLIDYSKESLKIAENNFKHYGVKGHFVLGNAMNLPFKDNFFDLTISGGLLEHFSQGDAMKILKEKTRVSKYIATLVPINTPSYWVMRAAITVMNFGWPFGYEKPISRKLLEKMYAAAGLKIIDKEYQDMLTSTKFWIGRKTGINLSFKKKFVNKLFANEIVLLGKKIS